MRVPRTGLTTIMKLMLRVCSMIGTWSGTIKAVYPDNIALHVALDAALQACAVLAEEAEKQLPDGV